MKMFFRQRIFSWLDSYDVYDADNRVLFTVEGVPALKHCFKICDPAGNEVGMLRERWLTFICPQFDIEINGVKAGSIVKQLSFFAPRFSLDFRGWQVRGNWMEWAYEISSPFGKVAAISKRLLAWSDTYEIDVVNPADALPVLMTVIAIDAVKCSRQN